jgi:hypothetical protein
MAAVHEYSRQYRDFSKELSMTRIHIPAITVGTIVALLALIADYAAALDAITMGIASQDTITLDRNTLSADRPTNVFAQRELKWLVHYHSATLAHKFTLEIPTADPTGRLLDGTDLMDLSQTQAAAWKTVFEALAVAPDDDTDQCVVDYVELVGRNL